MVSLCEAPTAAVSEQGRRGFARVYRVQQKSLDFGEQAHGFVRLCGRHAVAAADKSVIDCQILRPDCTWQTDFRQHRIQSPEDSLPDALSRVVGAGAKNLQVVKIEEAFASFKTR